MGITNYIKWEREDHGCSGILLRAVAMGWDYSNPGLNGLNESNMDPIQEWCQENQCGVRMSFDTFKFRNPAEVTAFMLRWA